MGGGDDAALLLRAQAGDLAAFEEFVRLFERRVRGLLGRILDDQRDVEEAAQDTFVQAWRNLDRFRGDAAPFTWLYRIAVNEALQRARRKRLDTQPLEDENLRRLEDRDAPGAPRPLPPDLAAENEEVRAVLAERLRRLPPGLRIPVVLRDIEDWSNQEIADALELSLPAAKSRIHRARMQLRYDLETWLHEREADGANA
jgi:RNA polymerase sigma-70 factor, ECF subfamily